MSSYNIIVVLDDDTEFIAYSHAPQPIPLREWLAYPDGAIDHNAMVWYPAHRIKRVYAIEEIEA